jgi:hypothetical protein
VCVCVCISLCIADTMLFPGIVTYGFIMRQASITTTLYITEGRAWQELEDEVRGLIILDEMCMSAYHFLHVP